MPFVPNLFELYYVDAYSKPNSTRLKPEAIRTTNRAENMISATIKVQASAYHYQLSQLISSKRIRRMVF